MSPDVTDIIRETASDELSAFTDMFLSAYIFVASVD